MIDIKFDPVFIYNLPKKELKICLSQDSKNGIVLPIIPENINQKEIQSIIGRLTLPQKHCLLFLACSYIANRACVIQGNTASGKSHTIRLFAKMLGRKLNICQINEETGISILTGYSLVDNKLSDKTLNILKSSFSKLCVFKELYKYANNVISKNPKNWKPNDINNILKEIKRFRSSSKNLDVIKKRRLKEVENAIREAILPINRMYHMPSTITSSINNGEMLLIEGIELASPEIVEKVSSLFGNEPKFNLDEFGQEELVHKDFRLIITYNPVSTNRSYVDQSFLNKCISFTLPPINSSEEYSNKILFGSLINNLDPNELSVQKGAGISLVHEFAKNVFK